MICVSSAETFSEHEPMLYINTNKAVQKGTITARLNYVLMSPCNAIQLWDFQPKPTIVTPIYWDPYEECTEDICNIVNSTLVNAENHTYHVNHYYTSFPDKFKSVRVEVGQIAHEAGLIANVYALQKRCEMNYDAIMSHFRNMNFAKVPNKAILDPDTEMVLPKRILDKGHGRNKLRHYVRDDDLKIYQSALKINTTKEVHLPNPTSNARITEWLSRMKRDIDNREKRSITNAILRVGQFGFEAASGQFGPAIAVNVVSVLVEKAFDYFGLFSPKNVPAKLESDVFNLKNNMNLVKSSLEAFHRMGEAIHEETQDIRKEMAHENNNNRLSKMEIVLNQEFDKTSIAAQNLQIAINSGKIDQSALATLTGITDFNKYPAETIDYVNHNVTFRDDDSVLLILEFVIHLIDETSLIVTPKGFTHWNLNTNENELLEYDGVKLALFNRSSNCITPIEELHTTYTSMTCTENNYIHQDLYKWKVIATGDPTKTKRKEQVVHSNQHNYIYCFPGNITISGDTEICPNAVLKIGIQTVVHVDGFLTWSNENIYRRKEYKMEKVINEIHTKHFPTGTTFDSRGTVEVQLVKMKNLAKDFETMYKETEAKKQRILDVVLWVATPIVVTIIGSIIMATYYKSTINRLCNISDNNNEEPDDPEGYTNLMALPNRSTRSRANSRPNSPHYPRPKVLPSDILDSIKLQSTSAYNLKD